MDKDMHGSRDYYYLVKHIVHHMTFDMSNNHVFCKNLTKIVIQAIARNFGGSETSFVSFMRLFKEKLKGTDYPTNCLYFDPEEPKDVPSLIKENLESVFKPRHESKLMLPPPRHLYINIQGTYLIDSIY